MFISVGSISLTSQQIFYEGLSEYINLESDKEINKNINYIYYLCSTSIISFIFYLSINFLLKEYLYKNLFIIDIYIFSSSFVISIILYQIYSLALLKIKKRFKRNSKNIYNICGYLIYCQTKSLKNDKNIKEDKDSNDNIIADEINLDDIINNNNKKEEENIIKIDKMENISSENNLSDESNSLINSSDIDIDNIKNIEEEKDINYVSCRLCLKKFFRGVENSNILNIAFLCNANNIYSNGTTFESIECNDCDFGNIPFCLMECCNCEKYCQICNSCCCYPTFCKIWYIFWSSFYCILFTPLCFCCFCDALFGDSKVNELYQDEEQLYYCYKVQRKGAWTCDLLFKNNLLEIIVIYVFLDILNIGFGKQMETNTQKNTINENLFMIIIYSILLFIIALFNRIKCFEGLEKTFNGELHQLTGITILNVFIVTILSAISLSGINVLKNFINNYLIVFPYALTKFIYFILINISIKDLYLDNMKLISYSTIISSFILIYKLIAGIFIYFLNPSLDALYLFQFIFGFIISVFILSIFLYKIIAAFMLFINCLLICLTCTFPKTKTRVKKRKKFFLNK